MENKNSTGGGDGGLVFGVLVLAGLLIYLLWEVVTSDEGQRVLRTLIMIPIGGFIVLVTATSYLVRYVLGALGDFIGDKDTGGLIELALYLGLPLSPFVVFAAELGRSLLLGHPAFLLPVLVVALPLVILASPVYYWAFNQRTMPFLHVSLDVPFESDAVAFTEAQVLWVRVVKALRLAEVRLRLWLMEITDKIFEKDSEGGVHE